MTSSSKPPVRNVPPPQGGKPSGTHARFIPREELGGNFAAWSPSSLRGLDGNPAPAAGAPTPEVPPPPPDAEEIRARVAAARSSGYQDGYRDGLVGLEEFKRSFANQLASQIGVLLASFDEQLLNLEQQLAAAVAESAVALARQVVRHELHTTPEHVAAVAQQAVNSVLMSARHISVKVHPDDLPLVAAGAAEALQARGVRLLPEPTIERGGCLVESDAGLVDARVASRWAQAAGQLGSSLPWDDAAEAKR